MTRKPLTPIKEQGRYSPPRTVSFGEKIEDALTIVIKHSFMLAVYPLIYIRDHVLCSSKNI